MVTVSNITSQNLLKTPMAKEQSSLNNSFKGGEDKKKNDSYIVDKDLSYYRTIKKDEIIDKNTWKKRVGINMDKTLSIPLVHFPRGLGGAPDFTFYEFLQTAKFPFYLGGPILAGLFCAGIKNDNLKSAAAAKRVAKHMGLGVGLYYVGNALSKFVVNSTVKLARGIDLNHPFAHLEHTKSNQTGAASGNFVEFRKIFESTEFTRFDLMYNQKGKSPDEINARFIDIAPKYGVNKNTNDVDSTLKPLLKKTIIMSRAWQYALSAFYVVLGIGMANQEAWNHQATGGFREVITKGVFGKNQTVKNRLHSAKVVAYDHIIKPMGQSFKELWKGHNAASSIGGKTVILGSALATLAAIGLIVTKTTGRSHDFVLPQSNESNGVKNNG